MAKRGSNEIIVEYDNSGGTLTDITAHVLEISSLDVEIVLEDSHSFGKSWAEALAVGLRKLADVTVMGFYDDAVSPAPDAIFQAAIPTGPSSATKTLKITFGGTKTLTVETVLAKYRRMPKRGEITKYEVVLRPTGTVTEA
jgi:hypothetical protein